MIFALVLAPILILAQAPIACAWTNTTFALNTAAKAAGKKYFGTATDNPELIDLNYLAILQNMSIFGQITPGNAMKWDTSEPEQNVFNFTKGDQIVDLAKKNGQIIRAHCLIWYSQLPSWVENEQWTADALTLVIQNHIHKEVSHFAGSVLMGCHQWISEPFNEDGTMRPNVFYDTLGKSYISIALQAARNADPNVKLYINEYNIDQSGPKIDAMVQLVKELQAANVPINGVGFECHLILGQASAGSLQANMESITGLGLETAITELDVRMNLPATDADLKQQKADYMAVVETCMDVSGCVGVTIWDFTDKYSWVPSTFPGYGEACPWDANLVPKPAHNGISEALRKYIN